MTKADIVYQTFKSPFALSLTDLYLYEGNIWLRKMRPTWFIRVKLSDSMWPNVFFLLTKVAWNIKYLSFDQLNDYQSVREAAVFKVSMSFN